MDIYDLLFAVVFVLLALMALQMLFEKLVRPRRIRRFFFGRNEFLVSTPIVTRMNYQVAGAELRTKIELWQAAHPMGALTEAERKELHDLELEEAGLNVAQSGDLDESFSDDIFEKNEGEDWRD